MFWEAIFTWMINICTCINTDVDFPLFPNVIISFNTWQCGTFPLFRKGQSQLHMTKKKSWLHFVHCLCLSHFFVALEETCFIARMKSLPRNLASEIFRSCSFRKTFRPYLSHTDQHWFLHMYTITIRRVWSFRSE